VDDFFDEQDLRELRLEAEDQDNSVSIGSSMDGQGSTTNQAAGAKLTTAASGRHIDRQHLQENLGCFVPERRKSIADSFDRQVNEEVAKQL